MSGCSSIHFFLTKLFEQVASKRRSCLVSRLLTQLRDITGSVEGRSSKLQDPAKLADGMQVIVYASRPPISWSQNRLMVGYRVFVYNLSPSRRYSNFRTLSALSMPFLIVYTIDLYTICATLPRHLLML